MSLLQADPSSALPLAGSRHRWGLLALLAVTMVWGTTFPAMKAMSGDLQAFEIIVLRFAVSSAVLWPFLRGLRPQEWRWGLLMGKVMFVATALQVSGLGLTSSNRNAFLTGLNVVLVPIIASTLGQRLGWPVVAGAVLSVLGMTGLFYESAPWSLGDTLTLASAFVYAAYVLTFESCAKATAREGLPCRPERLAAVQSFVMLGLGGVGVLGVHGDALATLGTRAEAHLWPIVYLGLVASAGIVWLQAWGQARVRAVEAALMYGLEPVFAAITAVFYIHEVLAGRALLGAALIVLGVMLSQWPVKTAAPSLQPREA
ncbi:DMT family transporter [Aquabacterium sp.]|uniref:DMT family transporter n=1 Tax=Aquabacterium sp. TaxID=1872578 RepID=UPI0025BF7721|nr:DMT family transporter [Aquabacterium sp.]